MTTPTRNAQAVSLVVTDLDNTLFDWFEFWHAAFTAMIDELERTSGVARSILLAEAKQVHQRHGTAEYSFLIEELPSLQARHPGEDLAALYDSAIHAYRSARKRTLHLYPGVPETLNNLRARGTAIVAYTESMGFYTADRIRRLELDGMIDVLYTQEDHDLPRDMTPDQLRRYPDEAYLLKETQHRHTPIGEVKPNPDLLLSIIAEVGGDLERSIYIGDSLTNDIVMAQRAGVRDVYASYGPAHLRAHIERYELLREVTHWSDERVAEEKRLSQIEANPTFVLRESFGELLSIFEFERFAPTPEKS